MKPLFWTGQGDEQMRRGDRARLNEIGRVLSRHGLDDVVSAMGFKRFLPSGVRRLGDHLGEEKRAEGFRRALEELGGAFPWIGRWLSSRPDVLPSAYLRELGELEDQAPPIPFSDVKAVVATELGRSMESIFQRFDDQPSGSTAWTQTHRARLGSERAVDGICEVEVELLKPGVEQQVNTDLGVVRQAADRLRRSHIGQRLDFVRLVSDIEVGLREELDLGREVHHRSRLQRMLAEYSRLRVPRAVASLCSRRLRVIERIDGHPLLAGPSPSQFLPEIAGELWRAYLKQALVEGIFLRDLRWRDLVLDGEGRAVLTGRCYLGQVTRETRLRLIVLFMALLERDGGRTASVCADMGLTGVSYREDAFRYDVARLLSGLTGRSLGELGLELVAVAHRHDVRFPPEVLFLGRTLAALETICRRLDPKLDPLGATLETASMALSDQMGRELATHRLLATGLELRNFVTDAPSSLRRILGRASSNEFRLGVQIDEDGRLRRTVQKLANRITLGLITAALIVGSALLLRLDAGWKIWGYPAPALAGFGLAAGLGLFIAIRILLDNEL